MNPCAVCNQLSTLRCSKCKCTFYCGKEHQISDWSKHKKNCTYVKPVKVAKIWVLEPNEQQHKEVEYNFILKDKYFPTGIECSMCHINGDKEYFAIFYAADNEGPVNLLATSFSLRWGVEPRGTFVIMRKKWIETEDNYFEATVDMGLTYEQFLKFVEN